MKLFTIFISLFILAAPLKAYTDGNDRNHVVIISIDGFSAAAFNDPESPIPVIRDLARAGSYANAMVPPNPASTWPSHTALATGTGANQHHVLFNGRVVRSEDGIPLRVVTSVDRDQLLQVPTLYDAAYLNGLTTAEVNWPVTRNAGTLHDSFPDTPDNVGHMTLDLQFDIVDAGIIDDATTFALWNRSRAGRDIVWTETASYIIENRMPSLLMLHLLNLDGVNHREGPNSSASRDALKLADQMVGQIVESLDRAGVRERTTLFIVSDHGFAESPVSLLPNVMLREEGLLHVEDGLITGGEVQAVTAGGVAMVYLQNPEDSELKKRLTAFFESREGIDRVVHHRDFSRYGFPSPSESDQAGQLLLAAKPGYAFVNDAHREEPMVESAQYGFSVGAHGYLNEFPEMDTIFIASGYGISEGRKLDRISSLSVAPTAAALLRMSLPDAEGRVLEELLDPEVLDLFE